ncbi:SET domain-containing protein [Aspergillus homomorphus CBS 101889]|uniref:SET domain protein n=1 Tax=Aspergillus homomorphus (strain CBS 101889) TaxID=1450537 RepID=A0A395HHI5_ASPHC|nr:SET domain protein [Aspergillus homomorphus CBS 101889]RAL07351.1 SET domain protein [Aspergillus homomorphus CBS 101889]
MDTVPSPLVSQLCSLLHNPAFSAQLESAVEALRRSVESSQACVTGECGAKETASLQLHLRIENSLRTDRASSAAQTREVFLGCIDPGSRKLLLPPPVPPAHRENTSRSPDSHCSPHEADNHSCKRRKTVGGLRLARKDASRQTQPDGSDNSTSPSNAADSHAPGQFVRQVHSDTRFPLRKKSGEGLPLPVLQPTSADKLIAGIWRQLHSPVQLSRFSSIIEPSVDIRTAISVEVFHEISTLCLKYYNQSQSSRALEMIVQTYWVECFEARVAVMLCENEELSTTEARMMVLKEACIILKWKEKDLRNRMAIWRGYKEIKDAGGWASLIFASTGVYRFCKYRTGFAEGLSSRLRRIRSSFEVAADTLHPGWRDLLQVIKQDTPHLYHGHPHEWVIMPDSTAVPLASTYKHLQLPNGFQYCFIDECVLDREVFGTEDPRRGSHKDPEICLVCKKRQSDDIKENQCMCFPNLFGGVRGPVPVQLFRTTTGKNNGVIARCNFDRGTGVSKFTGLITRGIEGLDVMVGGSRNSTYQIFQGDMGNFTRFINHSCRPNSQFQKFWWLGVEQIIVVSRGIVAGSEITVDYSNHYWRQLDKKCLCGEPCCRFKGIEP